jgi:hypothetical protein
MSAILIGRSLRKTLRRAVRSQCTAFSVCGYRELGTQVLDLSPQGMLIACDDGVEIGESIMVFFKAPGADDVWLDAEAEVTRIIQGYRQYDPGYCIGVRFTYLERPERKQLADRLIGYPPPIPQRRPKVDYAESIRRMMSTQSQSAVV